MSIINKTFVNKVYLTNEKKTLKKTRRRNDSNENVRNLEI